MNELVFKEEIIENWIKILLIITTFLIMVVRLIIGEKFQFLIKFWNIHRYFIYKSKSIYELEFITKFYLIIKCLES